MTSQGHRFAIFGLREEGSQSKYLVICTKENPMQLRAKHMKRIPGVRTKMVWGRRILGRRSGCLVENQTNYQHGRSTLITFARQLFTPYFTGPAEYSFSQLHPKFSSDF